MNQDFIVAMLRTAMQMAGASLAASGYVTADQWTAITGGLLAAVSVGWMLFARYNTRVIKS